MSNKRHNGFTYNTPLNYSYNLNGLTYKPKDPKAYDLRIKKKAFRIKLELLGLSDIEIKERLSQVK